MFFSQPKSIPALFTDTKKIPLDQMEERGEGKNEQRKEGRKQEMKEGRKEIRKKGRNK